MKPFKAVHDPLVVRTIATGYPVHGVISTKTSGPEDNEVHLWIVNYRDLDGDYENLSAMITRDERQKTSRYKKASDVRNRILRHGYLRLVLGHYLCSDPALIPLVTSDQGKPGLDVRCGFSPLSFSLSHTREMVVLAVAKHYDIGIDIVKPDIRFPFSETTDYLFTPGENAVIAGTLPDQQYQIFFRIWSLKEALLKARGGSAMMMSDTDVSAIIQSPSRDGWYPIRYQQKEQEFFIHESGIGYGHHCAIAAGISN